MRLTRPPPHTRPPGRSHRDFPRHLNGYVASVNVMFAIDAFTEDNEATLVVPATHQRATPLAIDHRSTQSWIRQQIDYVRLLRHALVQAQPPRTQQLLGRYTRVVTSLDEYYRPEAERLYRRGHGRGADGLPFSTAT